MASDERREVGRLYSVSAWGLACSGEVLVAFNIFGLLGKPSYKSAESFKANMKKFVISTLLLVLIVPQSRLSQ